MIDPQLLRDNPDALRASQRARGASVSLVDDAIAADATRRSAIGEFENLRAEQNSFGKLVAAAPKDEKTALVARAQELAARVKAAQQVAADAEIDFTRIVGSIANPVIDGVPAGGEENFVTLREVGEKAVFDFEPRDHVELGELLGAIDITRGTKVSGSRFYFLRGVGARLELALMNLALDTALAENFVPLITPTLVRPEIMATRSITCQPTTSISPAPVRWRWPGITAMKSLICPRDRFATRAGPRAIDERRGLRAKTTGASCGCTSSTSSRCSATCCRRTPRQNTIGW